MTARLGGIGQTVSPEFSLRRDLRLTPRRCAPTGGRA